MQQCGNCFGRFTKSQKLDLGSTKDSLGADKGETVPLNNSFETSSSNEMENNGISAHHLRPSSSISANHHISETRASAENDANSPFVNHGTFFYFLMFIPVLYLLCVMKSHVLNVVSCMLNVLPQDENPWSSYQ